MDIMTIGFKYKLERKIENYLQAELKRYTTMKWVGEQNKDKDFLNHSSTNIELLTKKIKKQKDKVKKVAKQLSKDQVKEIEKVLTQEIIENKEILFLGKFTNESRSTLETNLSNLDAEPKQEQREEDQAERDY